MTCDRRATTLATIEPVRLVAVCAGIREFSADLRCIGMCEFVEDGQGLMPGFVCGGGVAVAVVEVAEAGEGHSFEVVVAEFAPQCDRTLVVGDGLSGVPVAVGGVAEAF